ncbi:MAG: hypothetical protein IT539_03990 [Bradyrhizobiaceae bacterium]|nr:hypothetical protein [Bradyrhizobiaceae bacterium]
MIGVVCRFSAVLCAAAIAAIVAAPATYASELVYKPINPAFGGDPFNGTFLLETARAQDARARTPPYPDINIPDFESPVIIVPGGNGDTETTMSQQ